MQEAFYSLSNRVVPVEDLFFKWLARVFAAAVLVGTAWIDDAPPLEGGAFLITVYVAARVVSQFGTFVRLIPFQNRVLKVLAALIILGLLAFAFVVVAIFTGHVADYVVD